MVQNVNKLKLNYDYSLECLDMSKSPYYMMMSIKYLSGSYFKLSL